jgi:hypothetical protein
MTDSLQFCCPQCGSTDLTTTDPQLVVAYCEHCDSIVTPDLATGDDADPDLGLIHPAGRFRSWAIHAWWHLRYRRSGGFPLLPGPGNPL